MQVALDTVTTIVDQKERAYALAVLAPRLKNALLKCDIETAHAMTEVGWRCFALTALALQFEGETRFTVQRQALNCAIEAEEERQRGWLLAGLASQLTGTLLDDCLTVALAISHKQSKAEALILLAEQFVGERQVRVVEQALSAVEGIPSSPWQARDQSDILFGLAPMSTGTLVDRGWLSRSLSGRSSGKVKLWHLWRPSWSMHP